MYTPLLPPLRTRCLYEYLESIFNGLSADRAQFDASSSRQTARLAKAHVTTWQKNNGLGGTQADDALAALAQGVGCCGCWCCGGQWYCTRSLRYSWKSHRGWCGRVHCCSCGYSCRTNNGSARDVHHRTNQVIRRGGVSATFVAVALVGHTCEYARQYTSTGAEGVTIVDGGTGAGEVSADDQQLVIISNCSSEHISSTEMQGIECVYD